MNRPGRLSGKNFSFFPRMPNSRETFSRARELPKRHFLFLYHSTGHNLNIINTCRLFPLRCQKYGKAGGGHSQLQPANISRQNSPKRLEGKLVYETAIRAKAFREKGGDCQGGAVTLNFRPRALALPPENIGLLALAGPVIRIL